MTHFACCPHLLSSCYEPDVPYERRGRVVPLLQHGSGLPPRSAPGVELVAPVGVATVETTAYPDCVPVKDGRAAARHRREAGRDVAASPTTTSSQLQHLCVVKDGAFRIASTAEDQHTIKVFAIK